MPPHAEIISVRSGADGSAALLAFLASNPGVAFVRCQWQDYSGVVRGRIVPVEHALSIAAGMRRLHVPACAFQLTVGNDNSPTLDPRGCHRLVPDWTSLATVSGLDSTTATVMCGVVEHLPTQPEPNWGYCPRTALQTAVAKAENLLGTAFLVGFEVEFQVLKRDADGTLRPHSMGQGRCAIAGLRDPCFAFVRESVELLLAAGVGIGAFQTEGDRGQYEIALEPRPPVRAIDELLFVHDTLKAVFARQGLVATMAPRPVKVDKQAAGQHTHISLNPPGNRETTFLAGVLRQLPALCALLLPFDISYERVQPYLAGHLVAWGSENRAVPVRQIKTGHWELRCVDATANMYLALAAVISAGAIGCIDKEQLIWPDTGLVVEHYPTAEVEALPNSLGDALDQLEKSSHRLQEFMGSEVLQHYIALKKFEASLMQRRDPELNRQLLSDVF